jgi:hypothetical protein
MAQPVKEIRGEIEMVQEERVDDDWNTSFLPALNPMGLGGWGWYLPHLLGSMEVVRPLSNIFFFLLN